ncbi:hypothetical protein C8R48DRAFT_736432 [Suillus tomentosus]|nr:hypothetical protein C8R48DRAFT_736432 [Suillus tomentosus]
MRFSSAFVLAVVAALASSSVSAMPPQVDKAGTTQCRNICYIDEDCQQFACTHRTCLFNWFCVVSRVSALASMQYGHWH